MGYKGPEETACLQTNGKKMAVICLTWRSLGRLISETG